MNLKSPSAEGFFCCQKLKKIKKKARVSRALSVIFSNRMEKEEN